MTTIIGDVVITDPITLVITPPAVYGLTVQELPMALAVVPTPVQIIEINGQGPIGPQGIPGPAGPRGLPDASSVPSAVLKP